jgi:hypothetical protein
VLLALRSAQLMATIAMLADLAMHDVRRRGLAAEIRADTRAAEEGRSDRCLSLNK